jgi:hypothetical protein
MQRYYVARRGPNGWSSKPAFPAPQHDDLSFYEHPNVWGLLPSADLERMAFFAPGSWGGGAPSHDPENGGLNASAIFRTGPGAEIEWISRPTMATPVPEPGYIPAELYMSVTGAARDLSAVYFTYEGTLVPEDAPRIPNIGNHRGLYRYIDGELESAAILPDGTVDPDGAIAASLSEDAEFHLSTPDHYGNQVSDDGRRALFVSPDPRSGSPRTPQLYMRRTGEPTVLVSKSAVDGSPSANGPTEVDHVASVLWGGDTDTYAFGSPDGSRVFFQTTDALTADAPVDGTLKGYLYQVDGDELTYMPGVNGNVVASSDDGSTVLSINAARTAISVWRDGEVTKVADVTFPSFEPILAPARATASGSHFVFQTSAEIPGFPNPSGFEQIYRYEVATDELVCASCPPSGDAPVGQARMTNSNSRAFLNYTGETPWGRLFGTRGLSDDASRVYFDTEDKLVSHDVNGLRDVYEWREDGVRLLSSGQGPNAYFMDNSASGDSVFITTTGPLSKDDTDGGFDVYDVRVAGGFDKARDPVSCLTDCQGQPATPPAGPARGTTGFRGRGNLGSRGTSRRLIVSKAAVRGTVATFRVRAAAAGRVVVDGRLVARAGKPLARGATQRLRAQLTAAGRRELRKRGVLRTSVKVSFTPRSGARVTRSLTLTFERRGR